MSDEAREMITGFRRATQASAVQRERNWEALQRRIATHDEPPPLLSARPIEAAVPRARSYRGLAIGLGLAAAAALVVWAIGSGATMRAREEAAPSQAIDAARPTPARDTATVVTDDAHDEAPQRASPMPTAPPVAPVVVPPPPVQSPTRIVHGTPPSRPAAEPRSDALAREVALMSAARQAALAGELDRAAKLTEQHSREFPRGTLAHERWALRIDTLCRLGRSDAARATALGFASAYPDSRLAAERKVDACPKKP